MSSLSERQLKLLQQVETQLKQYVPESESLYKVLWDAMRYSLLDGGKRIRPLLLLEFCALCGGNAAEALPYACAIEMIHTYSLIHDDLPCMDDDDTRRGRPSNHKVFGDDIALLAGDALLTLAFEIMLEESSADVFGYDRAGRAAFTLAKAAGYTGMVAGQVIDLNSEGKKVSVEVLQEMDARKTGALIVAACEMGCILGGADAEHTEAARLFAKKIGLAFQIVDDILDVTSTTEELGKEVGSDTVNNKSTYVTELGLEQANLLASELTEDAIHALDIFPDSEIRQDVIKLAKYLAVRKK